MAAKDESKIAGDKSTHVEGGKGRRASQLQASAQEMSIMGTNDGSIVSKRSVERLYLPEPHFLRYFVKKPKRRPPMINRGYWLRMKTVKHEVLKFIQEDTTMPRIIVNLGCGYDPLPFDMISRTKVRGSGVSFVDVDYLPLMKNKLAMTQASTAIMSLLNEVQIMPAENVLLRSNEYVALGCDLSDRAQLESLLSQIFDLKSVSICFVAEISVSYMDASDADHLIRWAAGFPNARFVFLEQCLPWGDQHPYAVAMLNTFAKLRQKSGYLRDYSTAEAQERRFLNLGWSEARATSLWDKWSDSAFASSEERRRLDLIEPFDEWEEFALFGQHCFILNATAKAPQSAHDRLPVIRGREQNGKVTKGDSVSSQGLDAKGQANAVRVPPRSFGTLFQASDGVVCHHGGYGTQSRLASAQLYQDISIAPRTEDVIPSTVIGERVAHTVTQIGARDFLLAGGRKSPKDALRSCWLRRHGEWQRSEDLPHGLYRHCAVSLPLNIGDTDNNSTDEGLASVLVYGGKTGPQDISDEWLIWSSAQTSSESGSSHEGWTRIQSSCKAEPALFGASMALLPGNPSEGTKFRGLLMGGITDDGIVNEKVLVWTLDISTMTIHTCPFECPMSDRLARFGAQIASWKISQSKSGFYLVGGTAGANRSTYDFIPILSVSIRPSSNADKSDQSSQVEISPFGDQNVFKKMRLQEPLLVGHSVLAVESPETTGQTAGLLIVGGGANCFTFGTVYNESICFLQNGKLEESPYVPLSSVGSKQVTDQRRHGTKKTKEGASQKISSECTQFTAKQVEVMAGTFDFSRIVQKAEPRILRGLDMGHCTRLWTCDYLKNQLGTGKLVSVHCSEKDVMDFQNKNFSYKKMEFGKFLDAIQNGGKHYLRALSSDSIDKPADFWIDHPEISNDFQVPSELSNYILGQTLNDQGRLHSAVLRLSGPVAMWLHYDVMANVLCQISGNKRLLLFPPSDVSLLKVPPGQSSSPLNLFDSATYENHPELDKCSPLEAHLQPGDVFFIPALWLHTAQPVDGVSMAVNVFFRDLDDGYTTGRDAYGNRDLEVYEEGRRRIKRMAARFAGLPSPVKHFYLSRLAEELQDLSKAT